MTAARWGTTAEHRESTRPLPAGTGLPRVKTSPGSRNAIGIAALSLLLPGLGQCVCGHRRRGSIMLAVTGVVLAVGLVAWRLDPFSLLALLVRPSVLVGLLVADIALLAFRIYAVVDAYRLAGGEATFGFARGRRRFGRAVVLAMFLVVTAAPHVAAGYYDVLTYGLLSDVFSDDDSSSEKTPGTTEFKLTLTVVPTPPTDP